MIRRPPRSTRVRSSAASDVYKRQLLSNLIYSGARVLDVFVEGEAIRRDGVTLTLDEGSVARELEDSVTEYYQDV